MERVCSAGALCSQYMALNWSQHRAAAARQVHSFPARRLPRSCSLCDPKAQFAEPPFPFPSNVGSWPVSFCAKHCMPEGHFNCTR